MSPRVPSKSKRMTVAVSLMDDGVGALEVTSSGLRSAERAMTSERTVRLVTSAAGAWEVTGGGSDDGRWCLKME